MTALSVEPFPAFETSQIESRAGFERPKSGREIKISKLIKQRIKLLSKIHLRQHFIHVVTVYNFRSV